MYQCDGVQRAHGAACTARTQCEPFEKAKEAISLFARNAVIHI